MACVRRIFNLGVKNFLSRDDSMGKQSLGIIHGLRKDLNFTKAGSTLSEKNDAVYGENFAAEKKVKSYDFKSQNLPGEIDFEERKIYSPEIFNSYEDLKEFLGSMPKVNRFVTSKVFYNLKKLHASARLSENYAGDHLNFTRSSEFLNFCEKVHENLLQNTMAELKLFTEVFLLYHIPSSSTLFRKISKLILESFNKFKPFQVLSLYKCLKDSSDDGPCVRHLKLACLEYMVHCFNGKKTWDEPLESIIFFSSNKHMPGFIRMKLLKEALGCDFKELSPQMACNLAKAMTQIEKDSDLKINDELVVDFWKAVMPAVNSDWPLPNVLMLNKYYSVSCYRDQIAPLPEYFDKMARLVIESRVSRIDCTNAMYNMILGGHFNYSLLRHIIQRYKAAADDSDSCPLADFYETTKLYFILGCTDVSSFNSINWSFYRPKFLSFIRSISAWKNELKDKECLYLALNLAVLDIYDDLILSEAISYINLMPEIVEPKTYSKWSALLLNQCLAILHPSYEGPGPTEHVLKQLYNEIIPIFNSQKCLPLIEKVFGGQNYVLTDCTTSLFHIISYAVILDEQNKAVDVSSYALERLASGHSTRVEKIKLKPNEKIVLILEFPKVVKYFKNTDSPFGRTKLYVRILKAMGYSVVPLHLTKFLALDDVEQMHYVLSEIERVTGSLNLLQ